MTEINANSPLHNINPPITGINPPLENGNPVNPVNNGVSAPEQNVVQKGTEAKSLSLKLDSMMIRAAQLARVWSMSMRSPKPSRTCLWTKPCARRWTMPPNGPKARFRSYPVYPAVRSLRR